MDNKTKIKDLYTGKPDAKDEINFDGSDKFIKSFVVADHFNLDSLITGTNCFITGFKGTGKTALLFYLEDKIKTMNISSCTSYIFFKEDFTDARRDELNSYSKRILSAITVEHNVLTHTTEFEYIWRWIFFKQIVNDNETYSRNLFVDDASWKAFEKLVDKIKAPINKRKFSIPNKLKFAVPYKDNLSNTEISPELEVDFEKMNSNNYNQFVSLVDEAECALSLVTKTDIPYFIFVDELEAYYGNFDIFRRDLTMIRDLIFTVKRFNTLFAKNNMSSTKIICSVRSEIINAITRFIVTKEVNKVISGFTVPLIWNYSNNNSYAHPIIQILLKRIALCEESPVNSLAAIYNEWFPEKIHGLEPASYILNNSWYKPRDMIRLLICAQNGMFNNNTSFSQHVFDSISKAYSDDSLSEIREELRALYSSEDIDIIISCFTGFRTYFSINDLKNRIQKFFPNTILEKNFIQVLNDLYRLGFIGNYLPVSKTYHWLHRGDNSLIMSDEWRICIHFALHGALALGSRTDYGQNIGKKPQLGDVTTAEVTRIKRYFVDMTFQMHGNTYKGQLHISEFGKRNNCYISNLNDVAHEGNTFRVVLRNFNSKYHCWDLEIAELSDNPK